MFNLFCMWTLTINAKVLLDTLTCIYISFSSLLTRTLHFITCHIHVFTHTHALMSDTTMIDVDPLIRSGTVLLKCLLSKIDFFKM